MKKTVLIILGAAVLMLAAVIWQVVANLDSIVAGAIEDVGTRTLKTEVTVSGVSIDLKGGKARIAGMTIANPEGYSNANLLEMEGIDIDLDLIIPDRTLCLEEGAIKPWGDWEGGRLEFEELMDFCRQRNLDRHRRSR